MGNRDGRTADLRRDYEQHAQVVHASAERPDDRLGSWSALDAATGKVLWQTADPTAGALDMGAVSSANGVMYAGSFSGAMYALDGRTGKVLWTFASGGSVLDGPAISDGTVYWARGIRRSGQERPITRCTRFR